MALIGPDGEQQSQLGRRDVADPAPGPFGLPAGQVGKDWRDLPKVNLRTEMLPPRGPDKGRWVGPPRGQGPEWPKESTMPTPHEEAVLKAMQKPGIVHAPPDMVDVRRRAAEAIGAILEHHELTVESRRVLVQALGVLAMLP